jgi:hypothetical protein
MSHLLIVALELLRLVVALRRSLPGAMEKTIGLRGRVLVELVVPCGLAFRPRSSRRLRHAVGIVTAHGDGRHIADSSQLSDRKAWHSHTLGQVMLRRIFRRRAGGPRGAVRRLVPWLIRFVRRLGWGNGPERSRGRRGREGGIRVELHVGWVDMHRQVGRVLHGRHVQAQRRILVVVHLRRQGVDVTRRLVQRWADTDELARSDVESMSITCEIHARHVDRSRGRRNSCL